MTPRIPTSMRPRSLGQVWQTISVCGAVLVTAFAVLNLVGWAIGSERITTWGTMLAAQKITGSGLFIVVSISLARVAYLQTIQRADCWFLRIAAFLSTLGGLYGIANSILLRLQERSLFLSTESSRDLAASPVAIPLGSGVNFLLLGAALALVPRDHERGSAWSSALALVIALHATVTLCGYGFGVPSYFAELDFVAMPLPAAASFFFLGVVLQTIQPRSGTLRILFADTFAAAAARRLLPFALVIPFLMGLLHIFLRESALFSREATLAIHAVATMGLLITMILVQTRSLSGVESDLVATEEARHREAEVRQSFWELSADLLCIASPDGFFKEVNPAWTEALGWSAEELTSRPFLWFVHPDDRERTKAEAARVEQRLPQGHFINRYRHADGTYRSLQWRTTVDGSGALKFAVARDITESIQTQQRVEELNRSLEKRVHARTRELELAVKELESFSYAVSHDLRAPLRAIEGFSRIVSDRYASELPAEAQHYLQRVRAGAAKMAELIDGLQALSRLNRGTLRSETVDLSAIACEILDELRATEPDRAVEALIEPGLTTTGDPGLLRSLLQNLIGNAWKFTAKTENPRIELGADPNRADAFFVRDNGAGFDPRHTSKLFTPFQRLHGQDEFEGSGLGLATVQRIVNRHGGFVRGEGVPGGGATFWFALPGTDDHKLELSAAATGIAAARTNRDHHLEEEAT